METRITDPVTGGQKGAKLARFSLIPSDALWALAELYGAGAIKYSDRNWEKGYKWSLSADALGRHLNQFMQGKMYDDGEGGTGCHHLMAVVFHAFALYVFWKRGLGTNDLFKTEDAK
jgi:hypothetical protein